MRQRSLESARPAAGDLLQPTVDQLVASHEFSANVKTVQAFDAMLEELTRIKKPQPSE
jgi:flagellar hook protein FlgE